MTKATITIDGLREVYIEAVDYQQVMMQWKSIKLVDDDVKEILYYEYHHTSIEGKVIYTIDIAYKSGEVWQNTDCDVVKPSHFMLLPEPPAQK